MIAHSIPVAARKSTGLRIIAGAFKGRRLAAPPGLATRPLPDRVKQALFDWLGQRLDGLSVADCCAGSGAFTFEALSRGASRVDAIEPGQHALPVLRANAAKLGGPAGLVIHARGFEDVLPRLRDVDLIFCDPPFRGGAARVRTELARPPPPRLGRSATRVVPRGSRVISPPGAR